MPRPDDDMRKMSELIAEAHSIATRRKWPVLGQILDQAQSALLNVEPNDGEKHKVEFRPTIRRYTPWLDEW